MGSLWGTTDGKLVFQEDGRSQAETWQRWDEDLVAEFKIWLTLIKRTVFVLAAVGIVSLIAGLF